ncbi:MAG: hypothetical protein HLUCCO02_08335 [Idiomarinaceae bacterium HL-53]|nr:MAG: hypothetical protein HLUCCO02_08335 [Idiomarinaceae bacterium HL-53]
MKNTNLVVFLCLSNTFIFHNSLFFMNLKELAKTLQNPLRE